jgi:hypothetical protein
MTPSDGLEGRTRLTARAGKSSPATLTAAATTTTAATTAGLVLRLVDLQRATAHVLTVQVLDGTSRIGTGHFDEAEATGTTGFAIVDQRHGIDRAMLREQCADRRFVGGKGQIAHVNLAHSILQKIKAFCTPNGLVPQQFGLG